MRNNKKQKDKMAPWCKDLPEKRNPTVTIAPPMFPELFQRDIHLHRSTPILLITTKRLIQTNPARELVNRVKCAARRKRSERDGEAYGKSDIFSRTRKIRRTQKYMLMCLKNWTRDMKMVASRSA